MLVLPWAMHGGIDSISPGPCTLTVAVEGVANSRGVVGVLVFSSAVGWPERVSAALTSEAVPAQRGLTELVVRGLDKGEYAVVVLHDEKQYLEVNPAAARILGTDEEFAKTTIFGGGKPGKFSVYDGSGVQIGHIGVEDATVSWFKSLGIGGASKAAPITPAEGPRALATMTQFS